MEDAKGRKKDKKGGNSESPEDDDGSETDDDNWLRQIPSKVMEFHQKRWKDSIAEKHKEGKELNKILEKYKMVLEWSDWTGSKRRLNPQKLGSEFVLIPRKLKSIRVAPGARGKSLEQKSTAPPSATDAASDVASEVTTVPYGTVVKIGMANKTTTFVMDGVVYAAILS